MHPIVAFVKLIRLPNLLIIALTQYGIRYGLIYPILTEITDTNVLHLMLSDKLFFLLSLSTVLIAAAGYIINDYFDVKIDRVNRPQQIIIGKHIKRRVAMGGHIVLNVFAILIAIYVAYQINMVKLAAIQVFAAGILWYYSVSFKKQLLIGNIMVALLAALVPFVAGFYELFLQYSYLHQTVFELITHLEDQLNPEQLIIILKQNFTIIMFWVAGFSFFAFMSTIVREIIKDIEDYEGDKKYYSRSLPIIYGKNVAKKVAQSIIFLMLLSVGYLQYYQFNLGDIISVVYFLVFVQFPLGYAFFKLIKAQTKSDFTHLSRTLKVIMLFGILYLAVLYFIISIF